MIAIRKIGVASFSRSINQIASEHSTTSQPVRNAHDQHENSDILASATVKMLARQHKINLRQLKGTGRKGRILKDDIIYYVEDRQNDKKTTKIIQPKASLHQPQQIKMQTETVTKASMSLDQQNLHKIVTYSNSIPHLYYQQTLDVTQIEQIISKIKQPKINLLSILIKTFTLAAQQYPRINSTYRIQDPFHYTQHHSYNILIPLFKQSGVVFSTLRNTQNLNIKQISASLAQLHSSSNPNDIKEATISISNIGSIGAVAMNPLIYGQMACHASIGSLRKVPMYISGRIVERQVVDITMGCDHRVLDGATVARFTSAWRDYSEKPSLAFLNMI